MFKRKKYNMFKAILLLKAQGVPQLSNTAYPKHPEEKEKILNRNHILITSKR